VSSETLNPTLLKCVLKLDSKVFTSCVMGGLAEDMSDEGLIKTTMIVMRPVYWFALKQRRIVELFGY